MSNAAAQPRTVSTTDHGTLDVRALVLLAVLLAAGFILNFTVGKAISSISGGVISPEFITPPSASRSSSFVPILARRSSSALFPPP